MDHRPDQGPRGVVFTAVASGVPHFPNLGFVKLAEFVLRGQPQWDAIAIDSAMQGDHTIHVPLSRPLPVYVLYATAVAACDGTVSFYPDLYQHDATLERRLGLAPITRP